MELFYLEGLLRTTHYPSGRTGSRSSNPSGRTGSRTGSRTCSPFRSPHPRFSRTGSRTGIFDVWFLICSYCLFWTCSPSRSHPPRVSLLRPVRGADPGHPRSRREEQLAFGLGFNVVYDVTDAVLLLRLEGLKEHNVQKAARLPVLCASWQRHDHRGTPTSPTRCDCLASGVGGPLVTTGMLPALRRLHKCCVSKCALLCFCVLWFFQLFCVSTCILVCCFGVSWFFQLLCASTCILCVL